MENPCLPNNAIDNTPESVCVANWNPLPMTNKGDYTINYQEKEISLMSKKGDYTMNLFVLLIS